MSALKRFPYHFILLLLFFLTHGYSQYIGLIPFQGMLIFFLISAAVGALLFFLLYKILRSPIKAGIVTTLMFLFYLFYGSIKGVAGPVAHNRILVPLVFVIIIAAIFLLKRTKRDPARLTLFINLLLIIYLLVDAVTIISIAGKTSNVTVTTSYTHCDSCARPDIYFIIMDEYSGSANLQDHFHYNNSPFEAALRQRGFYVAAKPSSNYCSTPVSVASIFSMDYLPQFNGVLHSEDYTRAERLVDNSTTLNLLHDQGYRFMNHSIFNIAGQPGKFTTDMLPLRIRLITSKTMWNSIRDDLAWQLVTKEKSKRNWLADIFRVDHKAGNQRLINLTEEAAAQKDTRPRFIYTHLLMPHWPYAYDSTGKETGISFYDRFLSAEQKDSAYVQYLAYTNKRMLQLVDTILSHEQAVIILMSDHGFRGETVQQSCASLNNNFFSVYLPNKNYSLFYDSISNVNVFRAVFNTLFHEQFMRLPDACIF